jgi:hypothetical protein
MASFYNPATNSKKFPIAKDIEKPLNRVPFIFISVPLLTGSRGWLNAYEGGAHEAGGGVAQDKVAGGGV